MNSKELGSRREMDEHINNNSSSISDEYVRAGSGHNWVEWCADLDHWGAANKSLVQIIDYLVSHKQVDKYWAQVIAVYYRTRIS